MALDRLWAPWRMEFIRRGDDREGCFLCRAAAAKADRESLVVRRGESCFCVLNRYPYSNGHLLIAPYRHEGEIEVLSRTERGEVMSMMVEAKKALDGAVAPHGYNVGINLGRVAGAGLAEHFHLHIVPRWSGDTNFMTTVASAKVIPQALDEMWQLLAAEWEKVAAETREDE